MAIRTFTRQCFRDRRSLQIISQMFFQPNYYSQFRKEIDYGLQI
nr:MAG TPA: hypothetical protein [Caudoviricetes sp.]